MIFVSSHGINDVSFDEGVKPGQETNCFLLHAGLIGWSQDNIFAQH